MNNKQYQDPELDRIILDADKSLSRGLDWSPAGDDIRRVASRRQRARTERRRFSAAAIVGLICLFGWRILIPSETAGPLAISDDLQVAEVQDAILDLQQKRQQVEAKLALLESEAMLRRLKKDIESHGTYVRTTKVTYERNRDTWKTLASFVQRQSGPIPDDERWQLEMIANGFPDTIAGTAAQSMLTQNHIPESLYEKSNEVW